MPAEPPGYSPAGRWRGPAAPTAESSSKSDPNICGPESANQQKEKTVYIFSVYGLYREGYLHGQAREAGLAMQRRGCIVACQGPEISNPRSSMVTVLSRPDRDPAAGWTAWGRAELYENPEYAEDDVNFDSTTQRVNDVKPADQVRD